MTAAFAAGDETAHGVWRIEQRVGVLEVALFDEPADARARDALAVLHEQRLHLERAAGPLEHALCQRDVARAIRAEAPIAADDEQARAQLREQHVTQKILRAQALDALVERKQEEHVKPAFVEQVDLLRDGRQRFGRVTRMQERLRMVFESECGCDDARRAVGAQTFEHGAMTDVDAVKHTDRQEQAGVGMICVETAYDLHLCSQRVHPRMSAPHSLSTLSTVSTRCTSVAGVANAAPLPCRSDSRTPRALEHAVQTWIFTPSSIVRASTSRNGGQPTGTIASASEVRISDTASPSKNMSTSWPASANALACRNGKVALVESSDPQALLMSTFI